MSRRRRRGYSDEALDNVRLKNSRAGYLSRDTTLRRSIEPLCNDIRNVNEVAEKLLEIDNAFHCFEKAHYDYIAMISDDAEEWQKEARYFTEQTRKKMDFDTKVEKWIHNAKPPLAPIASNEVDEDKTRPNLPSSYSTVGQFQAKQALASLNSKHMSRREELLRLEEEIKLKLRVLEAEHEILKTELEGKWSKGEEPALTELPDTFDQPYWPNGKRSKEPLASMPKSSDPELQVSEQKPEWRFNPNAREFPGLPFTCSAAPAHNGPGDSIWSQQFMEKVAVTIKQGFALPQKELTVFNGDPLEYWSFITSFQNSIEANAKSESEKLIYLLQYTSGAAKDTIKCCLVMDPSIGYQRARMLLEERFGQPFTIAYEHVTKLTHGPPLRATDRKGLLAFADQ